MNLVTTDYFHYGLIREVVENAKYRAVRRLVMCPLVYISFTQP